MVVPFNTSFSTFKAKIGRLISPKSTLQFPREMCFLVNSEAKWLKIQFLKEL